MTVQHFSFPQEIFSLANIRLKLHLLKHLLRLTEQKRKQERYD